MPKEEAEKTKTAKVAKTKVGEESKNIYRAVLECDKETGDPTRLDIHATKVFTDIEGTMISSLPSKTIFVSMKKKRPRIACTNPLPKRGSIFPRETK